MNPKTINLAKIGVNHGYADIKEFFTIVLEIGRGASRDLHEEWRKVFLAIPS